MGIAGHRDFEQDCRHAVPGGRVEPHVGFLEVQISVKAAYLPCTFTLSGSCDYFRR